MYIHKIKYIKVSSPVVNNVIP